MHTVGASDAQHDFVQLLDRVERGESVTITRQGRPIAQLVPIPSPQTPDHLEAIRQLREFGKGRRLDGLRIRSLIDEGRRV